MKMTTMTMALIFLAVAGCRRESEEQFNIIGPGGKASLVAVLKNGVTDQEVNSFLDDTVSTRRSDGSTWHRPGVWSTVRVGVQGHVAYTATFFPAATPEQRATVTKAMKASPYVLEVFADVDPGAIVLDEPPGQSLTS
jgi:hypothetical protein